MPAHKRWIEEVRRQYGITSEEWATVIVNAGLAAERLTSADSGNLDLTRDEESAVRLALAYVMHARGEKSMEGMHPDAVVHLSWEEYKEWKLSGREWKEFYTKGINPQGIRIGDKLRAKKNGVRLEMHAIEEGIPFNFLQYDPDDQRMVGVWHSFLRHAFGQRRTFTWISLWSGSEWIDCEPPWENASAPPQGLLATLASRYKASLAAQESQTKLK